MLIAKPATVLPPWTRLYLKSLLQLGGTLLPIARFRCSKKSLQSQSASDTSTATKKQMYSHEEDALILEERRKGTTFQAIAVKLQRPSEQSVAHRFYRLTGHRQIWKLRPHSGPVRNVKMYTAEEDKTILTRRSEGQSFTSIGIALGRGAQSVRGRLQILYRRLGSEAPTSTRPKRKFNPDELKQVRDLRSKGMKWKEIEPLLGRTKENLRFATFERKSSDFVDPEFRTRRQRSWTVAERQEVANLRENHHLKFKVIAERIGRSIQAIKSEYARQTQHSRRPVAEKLSSKAGHAR